MKRLLLYGLFALPVVPVSAQINLASGGSGTTTGVPQSFNETRGMDVKVLSTGGDIHLSAITLSRFFTGPDGMAKVGARIYDSATCALLYGRDTTVYSLTDGAVAMPIAYVLHPGRTYRIGFFCGGNSSDNSGYMYQPAAFPYTEDRGLLRVTHAYALGADNCPANNNIYVPFVSMVYTIVPNGVGASLIAAGGLSPNPAKDELTVRLRSPLPAVSATVLDALGRPLLTETYSGVQSFRIALSGLASGVYFLKLISGAGAETVRFVKTDAY